MKKLMSVREACFKFGYAKIHKVYAAIRKGQIKPNRYKHFMRITPQQVKAWYERGHMTLAYYAKRRQPDEAIHKTISILNQRNSIFDGIVWKAIK